MSAERRSWMAMAGAVMALAVLGGGILAWLLSAAWAWIKDVHFLPSC